MPYPGFKMSINVVDDILATPGINFGARLKIVHTAKGIGGLYYVVKIPGHSSYVGRFSKSEYSPLRYMIIENTGKEKDRHYEQGLVVVQIEPGRKGKEAEASYINLANKMAKEKKAKS